MTGSLSAVPSQTGLRPHQAPGRRLGEVAAHLGLPLPAGADDGTTVSGITHDSREVRPGDLYAALPGARVHGAAFAADAAAAGAAAVVTDPQGAALVGATLPVLVAEHPRQVLGPLAAWVYGDPTRDMAVVGITGTNGKTTTAHLVEAVLAATGRRTGLVGTIEVRAGGRRLPSTRTTPEATDLQALFAVMREDGVDAVAMEVSSHALAFGRVDGVRYDVAVFTNLTQDHLDFHGSMEDYFAAKASLFTPQRARRAVVCIDDAYGARLAAQTALPVTTVALAAPDRPAADADWVVTARSHDAELRHRDGRAVALVPPLPGLFNVVNTALAVVACAELGVAPAAAASALERFEGVPGRMERVSTGREGEPLAVVDYAHTPDAVAAVLQTLRPQVRGRLAVVLGAGGDRDRTKRPAMGAAAAAYADLVVVTDDNPRSEDPAAIRAAVLGGARAAARPRVDIRELGDRREAIRAAVRELEDGDAVAVVGKGHEPGQEVAGRMHPFDDRTELRSALEARAVGAAGGRA